ncbi:MAG: hypothetical protein LW698_09540 [Planctomycetaceae bacterium]|nr:hypothetical protein [Planctomycetaceae bacterium]
MACTAPTTSTAGPTTPAVSQVGSAPGAGGSGTRQRRQAETPGTTASTRPSAPIAPPCTHGIRSRQQSSLTRNRASKLSVPSTITSWPRSRSATFAAVRSATTGSIRQAELICVRCRAAATDLGSPAATSASSKSTCRGRFERSGTSRSMIRTWPTPARTSASATAPPSAPQPTIATRADASRSWPATPSGANRVCRE